MSQRRVWNMFKFNQKTANKTRMPPKPRWKPIVLGWKLKFPKFTPNFDQKIKSKTNGVKLKPVKTSETMRDGRFSGTRNWCSISGNGDRMACFFSSANVNIHIFNFWWRSTLRIFNCTCFRCCWKLEFYVGYQPLEWIWNWSVSHNQIHLIYAG